MIIFDSSFDKRTKIYYGIFSMQLESNPDKLDWMIVQFNLGDDMQSSRTFPGMYTLQQAQDLIRQWQSIQVA